MFVARFNAQGKLDLFNNPVGCLASLAVFQAKAGLLPYKTAFFRGS
jgi:hypothetical protein